jgi:hypothetical protein
MLIRSLCCLFGATLALNPIAALAQVNFESTERNFPAQYVTKLYTEGLGRAPDQATWRALIDYYNAAGCNVAALTAHGQSLLTSPEFDSLGYDQDERILAIFRSVMNREISPPEQAAWRNWHDQGGQRWPLMLNVLYGSAEFLALSKQICNPQQPGYNFGNVPAATLLPTGVGFSGSLAELQATLDRATPGSTIYLAPHTLIPATQTLRIPAGITLATTNLPRPNQYLKMARIARSGNWQGATIDLLPGAKLVSVWVDGQRGTLPNRYNRPNVNVRMLSGDDTSVINSRISESLGATGIELFGAVTGVVCQRNLVAGNLITTYTSSHTDGSWSDGVSVACENAIVAGNTVIDATDVAIILFNPNPIASGIAQTSQVFDNTIIQAGNSAYGGIAIDAFAHPTVAGDPPGVARFSFVGSVFRDNTIWTSQRTHLDIAIAAGTRAWFGARSYSGTGGAFLRNTSGNLSITASSGIVVSGLLNTEVRDNVLALRLVNLQAQAVSKQPFFDRVLSLFRPKATNCKQYNVVAAVSQGYASGSIQAPAVDRPYDDCIQAGR